MKLSQRLLFWLFIGAVLGTSLDALHVITGVLAYPKKPLGLQDWWVPLLFAGAGVAMGEGHRQIACRFAKIKPPKASAPEVLRGMSAFVLSYVCSCFLVGTPWLALLFFVALFIGCLLMTPAAARGALLVHAGGAAITGPLVEGTISSTGAFHYLPAAGPFVLGVPVWLTGIYLCLAAGTAALDRALP